LVVDLSALLTIDRLDMLDDIRQSGLTLRIAPYLPQLLRQYADRATHHQPSHVAVLESVLKAVDAGQIAISEERADLQGSFTAEVVYKLDDPDEDGSQPENSGGQITLGALGEELVRRGLVAKEEFDRIRHTYSSWSDTGSTLDPQTANVLLFDGNSIEPAITAGLLPILIERFALAVGRDYLSHCRATTSAAQEGVALNLRLKALLQWIVEGQERGQVLILALGSGQREDAESIWGEVDEAARALVDLLVFPGRALRWLWVDDRYVTGLARCNDGIIVSTFEVLQLLWHQGIILEGRYYQHLMRMREHHVYLLPLSKDEVLYWLRRAAVKDGVVIENRELTTLRRYLNELLLLEPDLDLDHTRSGRERLMESTCLLELNNLARDCLLSIWSGAQLSLSDRRALSTWIWEAVRVERFERLPLLNPSPESKRMLWILHAAHLLLLAMQMDSKKGADGESLSQLYVEWLQTQLADINDGGSRDVVKEIAGTVADTLLRNFENLRAKDEIRGQVARHIAQTLFHDLPEVIRQQLISNAQFQDMAGLKSESVTVVGGIRFHESSFWDAINQATLGAGSTMLAIDGSAYPIAISSERPKAVEVGGDRPFQIVDTGFDLLSDDAVEREEYLQTHRLEIALPDQPSPVGQFSDLELPSDRVKLFRQLQESTPQGRYLKVEQSIGAKEPTPKSDMLPSSATDYRRDIGWPENAPFDWEAMGSRLIESCGLQPTLERLAGLPIALSQSIKDAFTNANPTSQLALVHDLVATTPTPLRIFRALELAAVSTAAVEEIEPIVQAIYGSLLEEWGPIGEAFCEVLQWSERVWSQDESWAAGSTALQLACIWSHADRICSLLLRQNVSAHWIRTQFASMHKPPLLQSMRWDAGTDSDVASPIRMSSVVLLATGLNLAASSLSGRPSLLPGTDVFGLLTGEGKEKLQGRVHLMEDRSQGPNALGSYLAEEYSDYVSGKVIVENIPILLTSTRQTTRSEVLEAIQANHSNEQAWIYLGALGPQWLNASEVAAISKSAGLVEFPANDPGDRWEATLLILARLVPFLPENARDPLETNFFAWAKRLSHVYKSPGMYLKDTSALPAAIKVFTEVFVALARLPTKRASLKRFAGLVDQCIIEWPESAGLWRTVMNNALRHSSYVNLELLWPTFVRLRAAR
jgi:hypothetical protein